MPRGSCLVQPLWTLICDLTYAMSGKALNTSISNSSRRPISKTCAPWSTSRRIKKTSTRLSAILDSSSRTDICHVKSSTNGSSQSSSPMQQSTSPSKTSTKAWCKVPLSTWANWRPPKITTAQPSWTSQLWTRRPRSSLTQQRSDQICYLRKAPALSKKWIRREASRIWALTGRHSIGQESKLTRGLACFPHSLHNAKSVGQASKVAIIWTKLKTTTKSWRTMAAQAAQWNRRHPLHKSWIPAVQLSIIQSESSHSLWCDQHRFLWKFGPFIIVKTHSNLNFN